MVADDLHSALLADASDGLPGADIEEVVARSTFAAARRVAARRGCDLGSLAGADLAEVRIAHADLMEAVAVMKSGMTFSGYRYGPGRVDALMA